MAIAEWVSYVANNSSIMGGQKGGHRLLQNTVQIAQINLSLLVFIC
jgi:hypothetical protein